MNTIQAPPNIVPLDSTNWQIQNYRVSEDDQKVTFTYLLAAADVATCAQELTGCDLLKGFAVAMNKSAPPGLNYSSSTVTASNRDQPVSVVVDTTSDPTLPVIAVQGQQPLGNGAATAQEFVINVQKQASFVGKSVLACNNATPPVCTMPAQNVLMIGQASSAITTVDGGQPVYNSRIMDVAQLQGSGGPPQNLQDSCFKPSVQRILVGGSQPATLLTLTISAQGLTAECKARIKNMVQPVYVRMLLTPTLINGLPDSNANTPAAGTRRSLLQDGSSSNGPTYIPLSGGQRAKANNTANGLGGVVTWAVLPTTGNAFTYTLRVPGSQPTTVNDMCAQGQVDNQAPNTCVVQLVSGDGGSGDSGSGSSSGLTWVGSIPELPVLAPPPFSPPPPPKAEDDGGLSYNEKVAIIVCTVVGGIVLLSICVLVACCCHRQKKREWKPAKGTIAAAGAAPGVMMMGLPGTASPPHGPSSTVGGDTVGTGGVTVNTGVGTVATTGGGPSGSGGAGPSGAGPSAPPPSWTAATHAGDTASQNGSQAV